MLLKKILLIFLCFSYFSLMLMMVSAQAYKLDVASSKESFEAGESIVLKVSLFDEENKLVNDDVSIVLKNIEKNKEIQKTIQSNKFVSFNLGEDAIAGEWEATAIYKDTRASTIFLLKRSENLEFKIEEDFLSLKNIGNTIYLKKIRIKIGDTLGEEKSLNLDLGDEVKYRLIAPEGKYEIKVIGEDGEILFSIANVELTGTGLTGKAIGAVDEKASSRGGITGTVSPDEESDEAILAYLKGSHLTYVFVLVIFGAMILLAIERRYRKALK